MIGYIGINIDTDNIKYEEEKTYNHPVKFFATHFDVIHYPYNPKYTGYVIAEIFSEPKESETSHWIETDEFKVIKIIPNFNDTEHKIPFPDGKNVIEIAIPNGNGDIILQTILYIKNNLLHRESDLPALMRNNNDAEWFVDGVRHRESMKPAIMRCNGRGKEYYVHGIRQPYPDKSDSDDEKQTDDVTQIIKDENKRYFQAIYIDHENNIRTHTGRFSGTHSKQAASKAFTSICIQIKKHGQIPEKLIYCMYDIKSKNKYIYEGRRIKLDMPEKITIKRPTDSKPMDIIYNYSNDVRKFSDDDDPTYQMLANYLVE
jgi:hypothetical protein